MFNPANLEVTVEFKTNKFLVRLIDALKHGGIRTLALRIKMIKFIFTNFNITKWRIVGHNKKWQGIKINQKLMESSNEK